jgi:DNA adenine methylase
MQPFVGYPGGKSRAAKTIKAAIGQHLNGAGYCEPFAGGFSFGLSILEDWAPKVWINEFDPDMYSLWYMVLNNPDDLCRRIHRARITPETFYTLRKRILGRGALSKDEIPQRALEKLIIHKISFSNMGEMSGSPVGGRHQTGEWKFDVRWKPDLICRSIRKTSDFLAGARLTGWSYERILDNVSSDYLLYLDPPYVDAGKKCYKYAFDETAHRELAVRLKGLKCRWFMTYDNDPLVHELYTWANVSPLSFKYFMSTAYRTQGTMKHGNELLVHNFT